MSVKLSTSRLRTAPGMGERTGCYRCGQEGHWSKECPLDQNGSYGEGPMGPGADGFGPSRFGGGSRGRGFPRGFSGDPGFPGSYAPVHALARGAGYGGPGYGRGAGYEGAVAYGVPPGYGLGAEHSMARAYGAEGAFGSGGAASFGAVPAYPARRSAYDERDPYGVVDFYEKYRARPFAAGYFDDRRTVPLPPPPPPPATSAIMRDRLSSAAAIDPYERRPLPPPPPTPGATYYPRDRSPIRRIPPEGEGYSYERSRLSPVSSLSRSTTYDMSRARDPYADRARYAY